MENLRDHTNANAMTILHAYTSLDTRLGGPPRIVQGLSYSLAERGHNVTIVADGNEGWPPDALSTSFPGGGVLTFANVGRQRTAKSVRSLLGRVQIVHLHNIWDPQQWLIASDCTRTGVRYVMMLHGCLDAWSMQQKRLKKLACLSLVGRRLMRRAAALHLGNQEELEGIRRLAVRGRYLVLPNGIHPQEWEQLPQCGTYRLLHPEIGDRLLIASMARLHHKKGPDILLEAFAELRREFSDAYLVLAGPDEGLGDVLRAFVRKEGLEACVSIPGMLTGEDRRALLQDADVFALPSHQEGHPMGVVEAAYLGKPLLITRECHCSELEPGVAAEVVPDDVDGVREGLRRMLTDTAYREALGQQARRVAEGTYVWPKIAERLEGYYRMIAEDPKQLPQI